MHTVTYLSTYLSFILIYLGLKHLMITRFYFIDFVLIIRHLFGYFSFKLPDGQIISWMKVVRCIYSSLF